MNTGPAAICLSYGFDDQRIQETIAALGMHARLGESAELIRREVIGDKAANDFLKPKPLRKPWRIEV